MFSRLEEIRSPDRGAAPIVSRTGDDDGGVAPAAAPVVGAGPGPRVSVIVPVRDDEERIKLCLEALHRSTLRDFEVIVADDASTDGTAQAAEALGARVVRLRENLGAAAARNAAAQHARAPILLFVDADVLVHPDTLAVALEAFSDPDIAAVFGSYDLEPSEPNLLSQYKNLAHRYYHQAARERATTFWTGCGAMRREVFAAFGGFDARLFARPAIEDIELGVRLSRAGHGIAVNKKMQAKHLKRWGLRSIVRSDVFDRAIPWTRLILEMQQVPNDLNLSTSQRISALLTGAFVATFLVACWFSPWLAVLPPGVYGAIVAADRWTAGHRPGPLQRGAAAAGVLLTILAVSVYAPFWTGALLLPLLGIVLFNAPFYRFFVQHRGWLFSSAVLPMHVLYYLYSAAVFAGSSVFHRAGINLNPRGRRDASASAAPQQPPAATAAPAPAAPAESRSSS